MLNSPPQIDQPIVYNLTTIFAAPHHNLGCTPPLSLLHLTTIFAAPHYKSTAPHHNLCCTSPQIHWTTPRSLLHLTTIFAAPHHGLCYLTTYPPSPRSLLHLVTDPPHLTTNFTAATISNLAHRNPTPALQKMVSNLEINTLWEWGSKLRSACCKRRRIKLTSQGILVALYSRARSNRGRVMIEEIWYTY